MGLGGVRPKDDPLGPIIKLFDDAGWHRWCCHQLRADLPPLPTPGEQVSISAELGDVVGP